jgi:hypothetical protein
MKTKDAANWMVNQLEAEGCLYQEDVVDYLVRANADNLLKENADGNLAIARSLLSAFKAATDTTVVWVRPDKYWRFRVPEDEPGREARG